MMLIDQDDPQPPAASFQLLAINNKIIFKDVYYNGFHSLKQVEIINLTTESLVIQLHSTLGGQLNFQLVNENIKETAILLKDVATNTVAAASAAWTSSSSFDAAPQFNQVFNYVNYTDQICLAPNEKRSLVLAFLPALDQQHQQETPAVSQTIAGQVFFRTDGYTLDVDFEATVCQSILVADELDTGLIFEDSLVGETYIKDITIRNVSAIDLYWKLNTLDLMSIKNNSHYKSNSSNSSNSSSNSSVVSSSSTSNSIDDWLQFVDASTFITLDHDNLAPIAPFSHYTFRVLFTPTEVGKFNYDLQIENCNDVENIIQTKIHATMRTLMPRDTLVVTSGNILDFGDCVSGSWNTQQIVLNNISECPIEIHFVACGNAELGFDVMVKPEKNFIGGISGDGSSKNPLVVPPLSPPSSQDEDLSLAVIRPELPTTSHKTYGSIEEYSSTTNSYASTDVDNIDMLTAFNEVYSNNSSMVTTATSTASIKQVIATTEQCNTRIEFMVLRPGVERVIQVSYRPTKDEPSSIYAGQFIRQNFNILLEYRPNKSAKPKELKLIQCKARTCTSFVQVTPQIIDFGDSDVGTQKSFPVKISNLSDICAHVELVFESKVLNCTQGEILMQPKSTVELKLDIYPRKVNPSYKRQITLVNYLNRDNDQIIEVSSKNVDKHRVTFHSLFYRILTPTGANFLDFGPVALNSPAIRTCTIVNIRDASLLLGIATSSQQEIVIYTKKRRNSSSRKSSTVATPSVESRPAIITHNNNKTPSVTDTLLAKNRRTRMTNAQYTSTAYLDLATIPHIRSSSIKHKRHIAARNLANSSSRPALLIKEEAQTLKIKKTDKSISTAAALTTKTTATNTIISLSSNSNTMLSTLEYLNTNQKTSVTTTTTEVKRLKRKKQQCVGITGRPPPTNLQQQQFTKKPPSKSIDWPDIAGKSRVPLSDLISILEHGSLSRTPLAFSRQTLEEQFVRYQLAWRTELDRLIEKGEIVPTSLLSLEPKEEEEIIIAYTPKITSQSLTSKNTASISFRLIHFDQSAIFTSDEEEEDEASESSGMVVQKKRYDYKNFIPVLRKVIVRAQVNKSSMDLGQKNINFGIVDRGERHSKSISLHNKSETPLLYTIKKSGSIASGDIHFGVGRHGVIRAFGKREIEFTFEPTLPGSFLEQLEVINIRDKEDKNTISLKAQVRRPDTFTIKFSATELVFDGSTAQRETIIVTNTNKQSRMFQVRLDAGNPFMELSMLDHHGSGCGNGDDALLSLSKEEEEEIENLEQKLKIATRKNQLDKATTYIKKLAKLRRLEEGSAAVAVAAAATTEEEEEEDTNGSNKVIAAAMKQQREDDDGLLFSLDPNASKSICVCFNMNNKTNSDALISGGTLSGRILIHEHKNIDTCKVIPFSIVNFGAVA